MCLNWFKRKKEMKKNWIYYGVFFSDSTKRAIFDYVKNWFEINEIEFPEDWQIYCDHMTLVYNNGTEDQQKQATALEYFLNQTVGLRIVSVGISERAIAVGVDFKTDNEHSHISVAIAPDAKPVESNDIKNWIETPGDFYVTGTYKKVC